MLKNDAKPRGGWSLNDFLGGIQEAISGAERESAPDTKVSDRIFYVLLSAAAITALLLALASFKLSMEAQIKLAREYGFTHPGLVPWIVEGGVVAGAVYLFFASLLHKGGRHKLIGWAVMVLSGVVSLVFNLTQTTGGFPLLEDLFQVKYLMKGWPPFVFFIAFHILLEILGEFTKRRGLSTDLGNLADELEKVKARLESIRSAVIKANRESEVAIAQIEADNAEKIAAANQAHEVAVLELSTKKEALLAEIQALEIQAKTGRANLRKRSKDLDPEAGNRAKRSKKQRRMDRVRQLYESGMTIYAEISRNMPDGLAVSPETVSAYIREMNLDSDKPESSNGVAK